MCGLFGALAGLAHAVFWALVLAGSLWALRTLSRGRRRARPDPLARSLEVLNERYARGEIDRDEYLERRAYLS